MIRRRRLIDRGQRPDVMTAPPRDEYEIRMASIDNAHRTEIGEGVYQLGHLPTADEQASGAEGKS